ncbi:reprolysin-like metallopeptidase [Flavobacterium rivuli]|uniref:T9SS type A sorting domain-containing protein n=1 Tax=Flavobacterium rivuli TaxID=498301 RepID=UPI00035ED18B|nr:zinc-dependent metalloprotease family protein [Flavobacterium rivuli]
MKNSLLLVASLFIFGIGNAQTNWKPANEGSLASLQKTDRASVPTAFNLFTTNLAQLKQSLVLAPARATGVTSTLIIPFPDAQGKIQHYRVYEASVLQPGIAAAHPELKSYIGQGIEMPQAIVRFSITPFGLHAMMLTPQGTAYIDPYTKDLNNYMVYAKSSLNSPRDFTCEVVANENAHRNNGQPAERASFVNDGNLRTYRLAMACTIEYAAFHINAAGLSAGTIEQKTAAVLAAMVVTVTRVDAVYERELAVTMQLIDNNEDIIFITRDDFNNNSSGQLLSQSQRIITNTIGEENFDIGHTVSTGGGGLAGLGIICDSEQKARGITGSPNPVGDPYDIDYVAHEMGHQFGANHTFNGADGSCLPNVNSATAVEPGSGTTIMGYAGICGAADVQLHSDAYFNAVSLDEIGTILQNTNCAVLTPINNSEPVVPTVTRKTIPKGTAFILKGSEATDADNDALTYCWEQANGTSNPQNQPSSVNTSGPNFRSVPPGTSRNRYIPQLSDVLDNNLYPTWEIIPDVGRTLTFAYTVRDNNILGGQTTSRSTTVVVNATAGPFVVTSQGDNGSTAWEQGTQQTITWNVAGTTANSVNTAKVNILLSTDGGLTFTTALATNTDNDGTEDITVPNIMARNCRIMVEPVNNIYYAVNTTPFTIGYVVTDECNTYTNTTAIAIPDNTATFTSSPINVSAVDNITSVTINVNATHPYVGNFVINAVSPDATEVILWQRQCSSNDDMNITFDDNGNTLSCANTEVGNTYRPYRPLVAFAEKNAIGTWNLNIADLAANNTGTLNSWSITVCGQVYTPLSAAQFTLKNFTLYPNPNSGSFTVQFESQSQNNIGVTVHDITGREVFNNSFANTGMFSHNISLQNVQGGIYMVTVQDGNRKEVRKVVVK